MRVLEQALDELERIDVSQVADGELHRLVVLEFELVSRLAAIRATHVAEWDARRVWASDGAKAGWSRLVRECSLSARTAKAEVRRAKRLRHMPATRESFAGGKLSVDQVEVLTEIQERDISVVFDRDERMLIDDVVRPCSVSDARKLVRYWRDAAYDEVSKEPPHPNPAARTFDAVRTFDSTVDVRGHLDPIAGAEFLAELASVEQELFEADWAAPATPADRMRCRRIWRALRRSAEPTRSCRSRGTVAPAGKASTANRVRC